MKLTKIIMGMPITIEIIDDTAKDQFNDIFDYLEKSIKGLAHTNPKVKYLRLTPDLGVTNGAWR